MEEENNVPENDEVKKPSNPLKKAKTTGKVVVNSVFDFVKGATKFFLNPRVPLPIKVTLIVVIAITILVVVVLDANSEENASAVADNVDQYMYSNSIDEEGKKFFEDYASLLAMPLKDINSIYDNFLNNSDMIETIKKNYQYILGTNEVKDGGDGTSSNSSSDSNDVSNMVQKAISMAEKGGIKYCQPDRQLATTIEELDAIEKTDCSGFVYSLFKVYLNIDVGTYTSDMISRGQNRHSENGWTAEIHDLTSMDELQPGDILLRSTHAALYVGDGKLVDNGGPGGSDCACLTDWRGPKHKDVNLNSYNYYVRYTNPNVTNSNSGTFDPNGNEAEGYQSGFTDAKGRKYKIYKQYLEPWASHNYWSGNMQKYGCGPTTLAIIASGYGKGKTPGEVADYMNSNYGYTGDQPLSGTLTNYLGIKNTIYRSNFENVIKDNLNAKRPVVVSVKSTPDTRFTKSSHIIAFLDLRNNSEVFIANAGANDSYTQKCGWNNLSDLIPYIGYVITIDSDS